MANHSKYDASEDEGGFSDMLHTSHSAVRHLRRLSNAASAHPTPAAVEEIMQAAREYRDEILDLADSADSDNEEDDADRLRALATGVTQGTRDVLRLCKVAAANTNADTVEAACASVKRWLREVHELTGSDDEEEDDDGDGDDDDDDNDDGEDDTPRKRHCVAHH